MARAHIRAGEVPELIRKTAEQFAGEFYDGERSPRFRLNGAKYGLTEKAYVRQHWTNFVEIAIRVLSSMLAMPGVDEDQKIKIHEAIVDYQARSSSAPRPTLSMRSLN